MYFMKDQFELDLENYDKLVEGNIASCDILAGFAASFFLFACSSIVYVLVCL
jgi:hypothetical protein